MPHFDVRDGNIFPKRHVGKPIHKFSQILCSAHSTSREVVVFCERDFQRRKPSMVFACLNVFFSHSQKSTFDEPSKSLTQIDS